MRRTLGGILSAALVYLDRQDDAVSSRLRSVRRTVDGVAEGLLSLASRGELIRLRAPLVQDFLIGILAARNPRPAGVLPTPETRRIELSATDTHWPPVEGQYNEQGMASSAGELAILGLALTYEEVRAWIVGLAQPDPPSKEARAQIARAAAALIAEISTLSLPVAAYRAAWQRLFSGASVQPPPAPPNTPGPQLSTTAPPAISTSGSAGNSGDAAQGNHTHAHGDQPGGTQHAAVGADPGFMTPAQSNKLAGIAPGATNVQLSSAAPPAISTSGSAGNSGDAAQGNHTHAHGDQPGGTLHAAVGADPGFMTPAQSNKLAGIAPGATNVQLSLAAPPAISTSGSAGNSGDASQGNHTHAHGDQPGGTLHAAVGADPGFMTPAQSSKLAGIATGATRGGQGLLLYLNRLQVLGTNFVFGRDGAAVMFTADLTPEVCTVTGTCQDWRLEANSPTPTALNVSIFRAPSGSVTYLLTSITFNLAAGVRAGNSAATISVSPGDRLCALCTLPWSPNGLTIRGRLV